MAALDDDIQWLLRVQIEYQIEVNLYKANYCQENYSAETLDLSLHLNCIEDTLEVSNLYFIKDVLHR